MRGQCEKTSTTSVLVVDDHRTFSDLLALALSGQPDLECVGTASNAEEAMALATSLEPDLVVMDVRLGGTGDGVDVTAQLTARFPAVHVIVLTAHASQSLLERAAAAGACCLLPKDGSLVEMLASLRAARRGGFVVHPTLMQELMTGRRRTGPKAPELTGRERDVLDLLADGCDARTIARTLGISLHTSRGHVRSLLRKLHAHSQVEALANAKRAGLLDRADSH